MAGSRRPFVYVADDGSEYAVNLDESTYEDAALGFKSSYTGDKVPPPIIRGNPIKMRYVNVFRDEDNVTIRRRFFVGDPGQPVYKDGGTLTFGSSPGAEDPEEGESWYVSSSVGEKRRFISMRDTAKKDGDVEAVGDAAPPPAEGGGEAPPSGL